MSEAFEYLALIHLPLIALADDEPVLVGNHSLEPFPLEELARIDSDYRRLETRIEKTRPVVHAVPITIRGRVEPDEVEDVLNSVYTDQTYSLYCALLLAAAAPLPSPIMTMRYLIGRGDGSLRGTRGPFGFEALTQGQYHELSARQLEQATRVLDLLGGPGGLVVHEEIEGALETLAYTALPDYSDRNRLLLYVSALERLVRPDKRTGQLTSSFAKRVAVLISPERPGEGLQNARAFYEARSALVHGGDRLSEDRASVRKFVSAARVALCLAVKKFAALLETDRSDAAMWKARNLVHDAFDSQEHLRYVREKWREAGVV